ncbi:MAG: hypothetical protein PHP08_04595 [Candidatus Dojkabacteria bacterium]|nr:hypothetical protein [Candidatus Dojkabacteria bacterium]
MRKDIKPLIVFIILYIFLLFLYPKLASVFSQQDIFQSYFDSLFLAPFTIIANLFVTLFLFLSGLSFLSFLELNKAKNAYKNTRNRIDFIKDEEIVCLEGTVEPKDGWSPLVSPISKQECVLYCYGNKYLGGGSSQIKTVVKPSGETILLNGWLSGDYVEKKEYDPSVTNLDHLFSFMMEKKDENVTSRDVASAPYFYGTETPTVTKDSFSNHEVIGNLSKEIFNKNSYTEIIIPTGIYG